MKTEITIRADGGTLIVRPLTTSKVEFEAHYFREKGVVVTKSVQLSVEHAIKRLCRIRIRDSKKGK